MHWDTILSLTGMLAAVAVILVLAYWTTRWVGRNGGLVTGLGDEKLCVLRQLRVGQNEQLVLVRLQARVLLLGVTAGGVSLLRELPPEEAAEWLAGQNGASGTGQPSFWETLQKVWPGKK